MQLNSALKKTAVIGASGKMGKGIAALLLQEIASQAVLDKDDFSLILVDSNTSGFSALKRYLKEQTLKYAEKNINRLRKLYSGREDLVSNKDIIEQFVGQAMETVLVTDSLANCENAHLVFEAISEEIEKKQQLFSALKAIQRGKEPLYFFTNTSSIPIHVLDEKSTLNGRIVGLHFYNPPLVQRLVELVVPKNCDPELKMLLEELVKRLNKVPVVSEDIAGFIGNGYLMQEIIFACEEVRAFSQKHSLEESIYLVDLVTKEWLLRPMGIFQLMDYVGLDVISHILKIMHTYLPGKKLEDPLIDQMLLAGKMGGQSPDGGLKAGFFEYGAHGPLAVYALEKNAYIPLKEFEEVKKSLGKPPSANWKALQNAVNRKEIVEKCLKTINDGQSAGDALAKKFLINLRHISEGLVKEGVALKKEDVDQVLKNGFYHLYGAFESEKV